MTVETEGGGAPESTEQPQRGPRGPRGPRRGPGGGRGPGGERGLRRGQRDAQSIDERADGVLVDKLVAINRLAKVVKGGKNFGFAALVVVGDKKGRVGFGHGKAREVPDDIRKATEEAKKSMIRVPLRESRTLHHDGNGRWG